VWLARRLGTLGGLGQRHEWYPKLRAIVDELAAADFENRTESAACSSEMTALLLRGSEEDLHCGHDFD
jgi:hypothetical protein